MANLPRWSGRQCRTPERKNLAYPELSVEDVGTYVGKPSINPAGINRAEIVPPTLMLSRVPSPLVEVYLLVEQETCAVVAYRRTAQGFVREVHEGMDAVLALPEIEIDLPLAEIYAGVTFPKAED